MINDSTIEFKNISTIGKVTQKFFLTWFLLAELQGNEAI